MYYPSTLETGEMVQIHDAKWNSCGDMLVTADSQGHLGILGFGENSRYKKLPYELFFETDYHPLVTDGDGYVIDEHTGLAPHLTNPGLYTNRDNEPHTDFVYQEKFVFSKKFGICLLVASIRFTVTPAYR